MMASFLAAFSPAERAQIEEAAARLGWDLDLFAEYVYRAANDPSTDVFEDMTIKENNGTNEGVLYQRGDVHGR